LHQGKHAGTSWTDSGQIPDKNSGEIPAPIAKKIRSWRGCGSAALRKISDERRNADHYARGANRFGRQKRIKSIARSVSSVEFDGITDPATAKLLLMIPSTYWMHFTTRLDRQNESQALSFLFR
jgi:hypothetical protein